ncbi:bifunctional biotin--[acetyl-CoA-carboxylase] ligase/biotin operon repressor BirA [Rheinheimera riviphila]|uniref:Bifunctional ligase/repressor BirA n=1 Tax=Rheinheimera riviphila TaxID=1834037 RepID=A0A437QEK9_9GAMM|nr:bifunctional biotin--[acetyl-CoA-carboxylase] ligase/biotin operon repressor BirA [Rheinheimera riviphila]RVU32998.1 bifunctional biotin--[acetyl-CoA-carboxylase] ligase/biotin operon repressor BirA [Rheinheimera riviphila]
MTRSLPQSLALQRQLIQQLSDGRIYSGELLAEQAGISRAAIARHISQLQSYGVDIYSIKGKGYKLSAPLQLLDAAKIRHYQTAGMAEVLLQHVTDSTNSQLMRRLQDGQQLSKGSVLVAEAQTTGRGRRGNSWFSPFGANLYFSMYWQLEQGIQGAMGLSLVIGLAVAEVLEQQYLLPVRLKWPNDIYLADKKLAGILIELAGQSHAQCDLVIGLGLNLHMPRQADQQISQAWTDLQQHVAQPIDRNQLIALLQQRIVLHLRSFEASGFQTFSAAFNQRDQFLGKMVCLSSGDKQFCGLSLGVDSQGGLLLEQADGAQSFYGGELSLRELARG